MRFLAVVAVAVSMVLSVSGYASEVLKTNQITKDKLGQLVKVEGKTSSFRASRGQRSPNSFFLRDAAGEIRVVIWPEAFKSIPNRKALEMGGTMVRLEAEVAEYREKIELHVPDGEQVTILSGSSSTSSTTGTAASAGLTTTTR